MFCPFKDNAFLCASISYLYLGFVCFLFFQFNQNSGSFLYRLMKNFAGLAPAVGAAGPMSVPHELWKSSLQFYLDIKHRYFFLNFVRLNLTTSRLSWRGKGKRYPSDSQIWNRKVMENQAKNAAVESAVEATEAPKSRTRMPFSPGAKKGSRLRPVF